MIKGYELGALDYITKPFNINIFKQKLKLFKSSYNKNKTRLL